MSCVLSMTLMGFYMTHLRFVGNSSLDYIERSARWPNCPIPPNAEDVCIHSGANISDIVNVCGTVTASFGHCQDRFFGLILTPKQAMEAVSEHTHRMIVQATDIGRELDVFVQRRSRWVIDTMGVGGYEVLTSFADTDRLALQQELDRLQNRCDRFFNGAINPFGFGSAWHNLGLGLAFSLHYNMTLYTPEEHKYFISMTTCTEADLERAFRAHPPETDFDRWSRSTINFKSPDVDVAIMLPNNTVILPEYRRKGYFWWRSMLTYYAVRPNAQLRALLRNSSTVGTPCMSIHVRHSDKGHEAPLLELSKYMEKAKRYKAKTGLSNVYLMTDDEQVIQTTKNYPDFQFHYMDVPRSNQGWEADTRAGISREQQEVNFLVDIYSAARCQHSIVTYSSNVGRLIAEILYATGNKEPNVVSLDSKWTMSP